jgi:hypothetical protein
VQRTIFGQNSDEVTGHWIRLHNEEVCGLYSLPNIILVIIKKNEMGVTCSTNGGEYRCTEGLSGET